jgi:uncharacterized LabA/DUF88 family protein
MLTAAIFIEGSNIYFAQKKLGRWLDWVKVKNYLSENYLVSKIRYYAGVRKNDKKTQLFLKKLKRIGFEVITKQVKLIVDEAGRRIEKANFDVEITADILKCAKKTELIILFSGDSDFDYLVRLLQKDGKKVYIYSSKKTLSWELKLSADKCFILEHLPSLTKGRSFIKI